MAVTAADVPFDLSEVKLATPVTRPGTVDKLDVITRSPATSARLVTVVAPAGYGKTTLLARWAEADSRPFGWVSLDGRDGSAVVFLRYVLGAIHRVAPVSSDVLDALSGRAKWPNCVARIGNVLAELERPLVLVLDDLHAVAEQACLDALAELVEYVPPGSQIALASREEPALPLARWRSRGRLHEIGVADLRLNAEEAGLLLEAAGVELDASELSELTDRTEGWPAGLYLAALSMQAGAARSTGVGSFAGDDRFVADYFRHELLSRLPEAEATFLKHTSILDRMSGGLCDSVLRTRGSAQMLDTLGRTNGFVVPLDRRGEWYRYHHLFRELLRNELERSEPDLIRELNARAMAWCIDNDLEEEAIVYGHAAGETSTVAGLLDSVALAVYYDGRLEILEEWLAWFSDDELRQYPAVAIYGAWVRVLTGRPTDGERWLALADGATSAIPLSDGCATVEPWVAALRATMMPDGVERALADANLALEQLPPQSNWITVPLLIRGVANAVLGEADLARANLNETLETSRAVGAVEEIHVAEAELALLAARTGAWGEASRRALAAQTLVDENGLGDYALSALVHVATARVALHDGRRDDARTALARAHRLRPLLDHGIPWLTIQVGLEMTRAHLALTEPAAARVILRETERLLELRPQMGTLVEDARELRHRVDTAASPDGAWAMSMTGAELRLLPYLATHLTFTEIASRLFISRNTAKTEAVSIYRKLSASSRSEAIGRAIEIGLLESSIYPSRANLTLER